MGPETILPAVINAAQKDGLLKAIYGDLAQPGIQQVGKALGSVLGFGNTLLWPIQLINERTKIALQKNLDDFRERMESKQLESVVEIAPEIGVPIAEKLSYIQDDELRALYLNLLENGATIDGASSVHPSFVNVINNMCPDEAKLVAALSKEVVLPVVVGYVQRVPANLGKRQVVNVRMQEYTKLNSFTNLPAYLSNLEGLGLLSVNLETHYIAEHLYAKLIELITLEVTPFLDAEFSAVEISKGMIKFTDFGRLFVKACI